MGLFSSKKTILVASTVYNMAGDEAGRPNFLKNTVYGAIMSDYELYLGETIVRNYLLGPGIGQRNFLKWAIRQNYPGLPTYSVTREQSVDPAVVAPFIPTPGSPAGLLLSVQMAQIVSGSYEHFVKEYVMDNYPANYGTAYTSSYDKTTNIITIQWFGGGSVTFSPSGYTPAKDYVTAQYFHYLAAEVGSLVTGSTTTGDLTKPSTTGYGLDSSSNTGIVNYAMNYDERVVTVYTGSEPPTLPTDTDVTTSLSDDEDFNGLDETWSKVTYEGGSGDDEETVNREHFLEISEYRQIYTNNAIVSVVVNENTPVAGQTQTITTWRDGDWLRPIYDWRIDTQDTILRAIIDGIHTYIYEIGTGETTLDDLLEDVSTSETEYFPYMPLRLDNKSITHADYDDITGSGLYEKTNRAYRRASGGGQRFSKLVDEVEDNADIDDIDYAFTHHGVGLNVIEPACRRYMYTWLKNIMDHQTTSSTYMSDFEAEVAVYQAEVAAMNAWIYAQGDPGRSGYGDARPVTPELDTVKSSTIRLACAASEMENLDMRISWVNITESTHSGAPTNPETTVAAVEDDMWWAEGTDFTWDVTTGLYPYQDTETNTIENMILHWQTGANSYKKLTIYGLVHRNFVYGGESVDISAREAFNDTDPTGFIIPLHLPTVRDLGIKDATQMATANTFIVFNTYEIVKQKWYEGFLGMLIIIIVIVVLSIVFPPAGGAMGMLGSNAAVGAAMGLSGTAAIVAGAIANAVVAIIVSKIITAGSTALFGEKWGAVVGAVINLAVSLGVSGFSFDSIGELLTSENLLRIGTAIANGYEGYVQGAIAEIADEMEESAERYDEEMKKIADMLKKLNRNNDLNFDPLTLTDSVKGNDLRASDNKFVIETLEGFIHRTTMTGSDIVDVNLSLINSFAGLSLELP